VFKEGDKITVRHACTGCFPGKEYTVGKGGTSLVDGSCSCWDTNWVLVEGQANKANMEGGDKMVYQVVVEEVMLPTASSPEKRKIVVPVTQVEAADEHEAIARIAIKSAKDINLTADRIVATAKAF
jgi:hypothetical protein